MDYIKIRNLTKEYGTRVLFKNLNATITELSSLGIVGPNGHGKSTLINIILKDNEADEGHVTIAPNISIGYFSQYSSLDENNTIDQEMQNHFAHITKAILDLEELSLKMATIDPDSKQFEQVSNLYQKNYEYIDNLDGFNLHSKIDLILNKFDFPKDVRNKKITMLSGGEKSRLMLAKILSYKHDMLILDEPTNHLDIFMINWLEKYLLNFKGPKIIISHDRYFLDKVINQTLEIENGKWKLYNANYSKYVELKKMDLETIAKQYELQQKQIKKDTEFINKNIARATTSNRAKSRKKALDKMEVIERPTNSKKLHEFKFSTKEHVSKEIFKFINLEVGFSDRKILDETNLTFYNNKIIGLIGRNGMGKTTLVNAIINKTNILKGKIKYSPSIDISYFDQKQGVSNGNEKVIDIFGKWFPHLDNGGVRKVLGRFLFDNDGISKKFKNLSGGERSRLFMAKIYGEEKNLIILDEPTNHLDIISQETIETALSKYNGALFVISHDRYFLNKICNQIWELDDCKINVYDGNYNSYLEQKNKIAENSYLVPKETKKEKKEKKIKKEPNKLSPNKQREINNKIQELEDKLEVLNESLYDEAVYSDPGKFEQVNQDIETYELELITYYELVM